jgi:hypothetical protein
MNKNLLFISIFSLLFFSTTVRADLYWCYAWEKDGVEIRIEEVKKERGFLMPLLEIHDREINIIVNKKIFGAAKYDRTSYTKSTELFNQIDTYSHNFKNFNIELDVLKKDGEIVIRNAKLAVVMYFNSDGKSSKFSLLCQAV